MPGFALVNTGGPELEYAFYEAERRVLGIQGFVKVADPV